MLDVNASLLGNVPKVQVAVTAQQKRVLRRLLRDLEAAINELAVAPRKAPPRKRSRLLYRRANTLTDAEVGSIVVELDPERVLHIVDKLTAPESE
jgi:hypothetical protein